MRALSRYRAPITEKKEALNPDSFKVCPHIYKAYHDSVYTVFNTKMLVSRTPSYPLSAAKKKVRAFIDQRQEDTMANHVRHHLQNCHGGPAASGSRNEGFSMLPYDGGKRIEASREYQPVVS